MSRASSAAGRDAVLMQMLQEQNQQLEEQVRRLTLQNRQLIEQNRQILDRSAHNAFEDAPKANQVVVACKECAVFKQELEALQNVARNKQQQIDDQCREFERLRAEFERTKLQKEALERQLAKLQQLPAPTKRRAAFSLDLPEQLFAQEAHATESTDKCDSAAKVTQNSAQAHTTAAAKLKKSTTHEMASPARQSSQLVLEEADQSDFMQKIRHIREQKRQKAVESPILRQFQIKQRFTPPANASRKLPTAAQVHAIFGAFPQHYKAEARAVIRPHMARAILASMECQALLGHRTPNFEAMQQWVLVHYDEEVELELKRLLYHKLRHESIDALSTGAPRSGALALRQYATDANDSVAQLFSTAVMLYVLLDGQEITVGLEEQWWLDGRRAI